MLCRMVKLWNIISLLCYQSSSFLFRFPLGFAPGPQFGVGFC